MSLEVREAGGADPLVIGRCPNDPLAVVDSQLRVLLLSNITVATNEGGTPLVSADEPESLLAAVWREACQHIELAEAVARVHPHLAAA